MDETIYNRNSAQSPVAKSRLLRLVGVEQWRNRHLRQTFSQTLMRPLIAIWKLPVLLCTIYYFLNFAWIIGVNATVSIWLTEIYKFKPYNLGTPTPSDFTYLQASKKSLISSRVLLLQPNHRCHHRRRSRALAS